MTSETFEIVTDNRCAMRIVRRAYGYLYHLWTIDVDSAL